MIAHLQATDRPRSSVRLLTVFGIPVNINASWVLIYALITWTLAVGYFPRQLPGLEPVAYWANGWLGLLRHPVGHGLRASA